MTIASRILLLFCLFFALKASAIHQNYEEKSGQTLFHIQANGQTVCTFDNTGTNVFEYYHPDYLGSTSLQTDQNGNQIQHFEYSAFGQTRYTQSTNLFKVSRLYTGHKRVSSLLCTLPSSR
jgi:hypothetical protein